MKKLTAEAPDRVVVAEVEDPRPKPDEVLVRAVRSLLSPGSELKRVCRSHAAPGATWPSRDLGYAICGEVIEVGSDVTRFKVGDRVATMENHQELVASPAGEDNLSTRVTIPIPDDVSWDRAPFIVWGRSCYNWTRRARLEIGESVAVVGLGLVGLLMAMWSKARGACPVIGIDLFESRLALGRNIGMDHLVDAAEVDAVQAVCDLTDGRGADATLHCVSGPSVKSFESSQRLTRSGGRVVLIGHHSQPLTILRHEFTGKDLLGSSVDYERDHRLYYEGIKLLRAGKLPVQEIVTHSEPFTEAPAVYGMLIERPHDAGAVLLRWDI